MPTKEGFKERIARNMGIDPLETKNQTAEQIANLFHPDVKAAALGSQNEVFKRALEELVAEGCLVKKGNTYSINMDDWDG